MWTLADSHRKAMREKCPYSEFFCFVFSRIWTEYGEILRIQSECGKILRISPYSVQMRENTPYLSVFSPNKGKYGPEKLWIRTLFTQLVFVIKLVLKVVKKQVVKLVKKLVQLRSWYFFLFFLTYYFGDTHLLMCIKPILFVCIFVIICRFFQITPAWYTL